MMNLLSMNNISKSCGAKLILNRISFGIEEGEKIGLLGINGCGKSTFLKLVAGREEPDHGQIVNSRRLRVQYLPQDPLPPSDVSVLEATLSIAAPDPSLEQWTVESEARILLTRLGITDFDCPLQQLSGGQRQRVGLAAALMHPADLLVLDEPTNHLDNQLVEWLEKYLLRYKGALLMVTHDRYFLERVTGRIIELDNGALYSCIGNYSRYLETKLAREEQAAAAANKRQALLRKELAWIRRGAKARSTKQKARLERFEQLSRDAVPQESQSLRIASTASRLGKKTIILHRVSHSYPGNLLVRDLSLTLPRGARIGIVGPNGTGKTTLLGIMSGAITPERGAVEIGDTVKIAYFPQESIGLPDNLRIIDYIREAGEYLQSGRKMLSAAQMLETFLFPPYTHWTPLTKLSGGEKRRLHLLRTLMGAPNVLLLDEPGNNLDIETLTILEDYLDDFPGAVATVSHDRYFLDRMSSMILAFEGEGRWGEYPGNYTDYLRLAAAQPAAPVLDASRPEAARNVQTQGKSVAKQPRFTFREQREFAEIDAKIAAAENELKQLAAQIEAAASDYLQLQSLTLLHDRLEEDLEYLLERWIYLHDLADQARKPSQPV